MGCQKKSDMENYRLWDPSFHTTAAEIEKACKQEQENLNRRLDLIAQIGDKADFATTTLALERALTEMERALMPKLFMKYVSDQAPLRDAANACEMEVEKLRVEVFARKDLYAALKTAEAKKEKLSAIDAKLQEEYLRGFRRNGLELSDADREKYIGLRKRIVELATAFDKELIDWVDAVEMTREELDGMPEDYINRLEKTPKGAFKVTVKYPDYNPFMENARNAQARKKLEERFYLRGGEKNRDRMEETLRLRDQAAKMLGFANHAAYVLDDRMAKTPKNVAAFLDRVGKRLKAKGQENLKDLLAQKNEDLGSASDGVLHSYDWRYYDNQIKKRKHEIDTQLIKEYFPLETVNHGMFEIYETLLGVKFEEDPSLGSWHDSVKGYAVKKGGETVALFYMDLFPREGKYGHAAAFTLIQGCENADGTYQVPVSAIVANFNPPTAKAPSLLEHGEVETLFHEFGHIMHQVMTRAKHASFAGTSVKRDFVEAPSQMLENWVWEAPTLAKLSGHYKDPSKPLPGDQMQRLIDAKLLNVGIRYLRQLFFATLDQNYHTSPPTDSTAVYAKLAKDIMLIPIPPKTLPQASFNHLMGGYDSGYYGYLWSEVYAQDMFTRFEKEGLLNPKTGGDYLHMILEQGGQKEPMELITEFLGRAPNEEAFFRSLGL